MRCEHTAEPVAVSSQPLSAAEKDSDSSAKSA